MTGVNANEIEIDDPIFTNLEADLEAEGASSLNVATFIENIVYAINGGDPYYGGPTHKSTLLLEEINDLANKDWTLDLADNDAPSYAYTVADGQYIAFIVNWQDLSNSQVGSGHDNYDDAQRVADSLVYEIGHAEDPQLTSIEYIDDNNNTAYNALAVGAEMAEALISEAKSVYNQIAVNKQDSYFKVGAGGQLLSDENTYFYSDPEEALLLGAADIAVEGQSTETKENFLSFYWNEILDQSGLKDTDTNPMLSYSNTDSTVLGYMKSMVMTGSNLDSSDGISFYQNDETYAITMTVNFYDNGSGNYYTEFNGSSAKISSYIESFGGYGAIAAPVGTAGGQGKPLLISAAQSGMTAYQAFDFSTGGYMVDAYINGSNQETIYSYSSGSFDADSWTNATDTNLISVLQNYAIGASQLQLDTSSTPIDGSQIKIYSNIPEDMGYVTTDYTGRNGTGTVNGNKFAFSDGNSLTLDPGTAGTASYSNSSSTVTAPLAFGGNTLATLTFDTSANTDSVSFGDGLSVTLPGISGNMEVTAASASESPLYALEDYLDDLGYTGDLEDANSAYLNPTGSAYTVTGSVFGGTDTFDLTSNTPGAVVTGMTGKYNVLDTSDDNISQDAISNIQELDTGNITLTNAQFTGIDLITGGGTITAADSGTFDLKASNIDQSAEFDLTASDWDGTTLIGNNTNGQTLTASLLGDDELIAGNGTDDTLIAGAGVDTLEGGTGGDDFIATGASGSTDYGPNTLAADSVIQGQGTGNSLTVNGDISGDTITDIQTLITGGTSVAGGFTNNSITLTSVQWNAFDNIELGVLTYSPVFTIDAATGGIYDLATEDTTSSTDPFNMTALSNAGTTLTGNDGYGETLTASATGNDVLTAGNGYEDQLIAGGGNDTLTSGGGDGDTLTAGSGTDTLTAGNGSGDTLVAGAGVDTLISGTGNDDTFDATDGLTAGSSVEANGTGATLETNGDITGSTISGVSELETDDITLTASQFNSFTTITGDGDGGDITGTTSGTYNLASRDSGTESFDMTATSSGGSTLIGNNGADEILTASDTGNDTLTAGNGAGDELDAGDGNDSLTAGNGTGDTLVAGGGVDTLAGGTGGDTFEADDGLASGSSVTGSGTGNVLEASGNISGASISGIQTLTLEGNVILTSAQYASFTTVNVGSYAYTISDGSITAASAASHAGTTGLSAMVVIDSAANVQSNLDALQTLASDSELTSITFTDLTPPVITLTATQLADDTGALAAISGTYYLSVTDVTAANAATVAAETNVTSVAVSDTAANVTSNIASLETLAAAGSLTSIAFTDSGTPALSFNATDAATDIDAISTFTGAFTLTVTDTAANVATNIDALGELASIGDITSIVLTDGGTPTLDLSATQVGNDAAALALITSAYTVAISDTGDDVAANLDALQTLATAGTLSSITLTDTTTPTLSITETQLSGDSGALAAIGSTYDLAVSDVLAADAATVAATTGVTSVSVSDTAANVQSNLSALETLAAATTLASIFFTDTDVPTLSVTETQLTSDADALALIAGSYNLTVTSVAAADAATVAATAGVTTVSISDTAANVVANLDELQALAAAGELGTITLTDSGTPTLSLSQAQLATDSGAIAAITGSYDISLSSVLAGSAATVAAETDVTSVAVSDTAANVTANLAALETLAADSELASITLLDPGTPTLTITASQLSSDSGALATIVGSYDLAVTSVLAANVATVASNTHVTSISVSDTSTNVVANLSALETVDTGGQLAGIALTDGGTPTLTITGTQFSSDGGALGAITSAYHLAVTSVLAANASTVGANSHVTSITISDTAANVASNIDSIESVESKLATFSLTDSGTPTMTISYTQLINDATALGFISGTFHIAVSNTLAANAATAATKRHVTSILVSDTAAHVTTSLSSLETLATAGTLTSVSFTDSGTPTLTLTYTQLTGNTALLATFATAYDLAITGVAAANAATVGANTHVTSITVSDTSANIATNINALESVAGVLTSITATDGASAYVTITAAQANSDYGALSQLTGSFHIGVTDTAANISANIDALQTLNTFATSKLVITASDGASNNIIITAAQAGNDSGAISRSSGSFHVEVRDSAANISADFASLQALVTAGKLTDVVFTDSGTPTLALTYTQYSSGTAPTIFTDISGSYNMTVSAVPYADLSTVLAHAHVTSATVSDTAATISTNLGTLQTDAAAGTVTGVTVTNGGTAAVTLTYTQLSSDATVLGLFTGTYSFKVSVVTVANAATVLAVSHVSSISISDTSANVIASINTLETYAAAAQIYGIVLTDGGTPAITATATQGANDVTAFNLISSTYHLTINDTAANVQTNLDGLQALYAAIGGSDFTAITLTDGTEPTLTISATQATSDASAIGKITSAYHLTVSDTAANVVSNLTGLESLGTKLTTIVLTDGGTPNLAITGTQYTADITAIGKITSAYTLTVSSVTGANVSTVAANAHVSSFTVSDTAANISTYIDTLQAQSAKITSINITNHTTPLSITLTQLTNDTTALGLISVSYSLSVSGVSIANASTILGEPNVTSVSITDTAANISANIDALQTLEADGELGTITISGTGKVGITATQAANDAAAINTITPTDSVTVTDTSANILANLAALKSINPELYSIVLTDGGTPTLDITGAQYYTLNYITELNKITSAYSLSVSDVSAGEANTVGANGNTSSYAVVDTAANVASGSNLESMELRISNLSSITFTDSGTAMFSINGAEDTSYASAIAKIVSAYDETVTATTNSNQTLTGTGSINTVSFSGEGQGVTANLSTGTATTVHSGTTDTYTLIGFTNLTGSTLADTLTAGSSGGILTGDGGADTYVLNASSGYDIAQDTATHLNGTTIQNFSVLDGIDLTNVAYSGSTTLGFVENGAGTQGTLTVSDGTHTAAITLLGNYTTSSFQDVSDGASGTLVAMASTTHLTAILAAAQA